MSILMELTRKDAVRNSIQCVKVSRGNEHRPSPTFRPRMLVKPIDRLIDYTEKAPLLVG